MNLFQLWICLAEQYGDIGLPPKPEVVEVEVEKPSMLLTFLLALNVILLLINLVLLFWCFWVRRVKNTDACLEQRKVTVETTGSQASNESCSCLPGSEPSVESGRSLEDNKTSVEVCTQESKGCQTMVKHCDKASQTDDVIVVATPDDAILVAKVLAALTLTAYLVKSSRGRALML
ncbi:uncharacterized protein LOC131946560 [Physella acuta]|uniref:uncharacterized protein LOC131946560 n=1 Tax=Physella acuta TaxID=109671 RepID=UPI0027DB2503|nr:uncharacterized protein LOC131946560 [Physella acuta]